MIAQPSRWNVQCSQQLSAPRSRAFAKFQAGLWAWPCRRRRWSVWTFGWPFWDELCGGQLSWQISWEREGFWQKPETFFGASNLGYIYQRNSRTMARSAKRLGNASAWPKKILLEERETGAEGVSSSCSSCILGEIFRFSSTSRLRYLTSYK